MVHCSWNKVTQHDHAVIYTGCIANVIDAYKFDYKVSLVMCMVFLYSLLHNNRLQRAPISQMHVGV